MSVLLNFTAIRDVEKLSPKQIDQKGIKTHPKNLQSQRYKKWIELCKKEVNKELIASLENFVNGNEAITTYEQVPNDLQKVIKFVEYNGYQNIELKEFMKQIDLRKIANELGSKNKKGHCFDVETPFFNLITNLNDQLLALTQVDSSKKYDFDIQGTIKTLKLIETIYFNGKDKININLEKHYAKPMVIESCIINIDPCTLLPRVPKPLPIGGHTNEDGTLPEKPKEKKCRCKGKKKDCECKCEETCVEQNPCCVKIKPYIAELFVVKDEICKYEPGEMSYIENVIESEIKVRKHRHLKTEEIYIENEEETNTYDEKDLQVDEQYSLHKEVDKVVEQSLSIDAGVTHSNSSSFGGSVGALTLSANSSFSANLNTSRNWSKKETRKQVQDESKNVISKAISRVQKKIRTLSTKKLINEIEEKNKHVFGGTTGAEKDLSKQFYYVNKISKAQVYSHGLRTMLDFYLPEPSELLKRLVEKQFDLKKPLKPCINIEEIGTTKKDWLEYVQCYGFTELEQPPKTPPTLYRTFTMSKKSTDKRLVIPPGYKATRMEYVSGHSNREFPHLDARMTITIGSSHISNYWQAGAEPPVAMNETGNLPVKVTDDHANSDASLTIKVTLTPNAVNYLPWQLQVHKLLMKKYGNELTAYNEALVAFEKSKENHFNKNPFILSEMMKEQLKHAAISYITCQFFDDNNALKNKVEPCGFPQMNLPETKKEGEFVRFIEQAFEWKFINYMLYPYFWGKKCTWEDKFKEESDNYLFTKFLQAGYARVSISIRPGFEALVNYYLQTRRIWGQSGVPPIIGDGYVAIHQEIKESKDNFNADRDGYVTWNSTLNKNEIQLCDNLDYYIENLDPITGLPNGTYTFDKDEAKIDINREITINCVTYKIVDITEVDPINYKVKITLDRKLEIDCCCNGENKEFNDIYDSKELPWSTGALFIGAPWKFSVPTSLTWLREESGCLPCYPINCKKEI